MRRINEPGLYLKMHSSVADDRCSNQPGAATDAGCSLYPFGIDRVDSGLADVVSLNASGRGATGKKTQPANGVRARKKIGARILLCETVFLRLSHGFASKEHPAARRSRM